MYKSLAEHPEGDPPGKPLPPWRDGQDDPGIAGTPETSALPKLPAAVKKTVSTLASELRSLVFRDRRTRARRDRR